MLGTIMPDRSTAANNVSTIDMRTEKKRRSIPCHIINLPSYCSYSLKFSIDINLKESP